MSHSESHACKTVTLLYLPSAKHNNLILETFRACSLICLKLEDTERCLQYSDLQSYHTQLIISYNKIVGKILRFKVNHICVLIIIICFQMNHINNTKVFFHLSNKQIFLSWVIILFSNCEAMSTKSKMFIHKSFDYLQRWSLHPNSVGVDFRSLLIIWLHYLLTWFNWLLALTLTLPWSF